MKNMNLFRAMRLLVFVCGFSNAAAYAQTPMPTPIQMPDIHILQGPTLSDVLKYAPSAPIATRPELPLAALPAVARVYWMSNSPDDRMRRLRSEAATLIMEARYHGWKQMEAPLVALSSEYSSTSAEDEFRAMRENSRKYLEVMAQIESLRTGLQMVPTEPDPDEIHIVEHTGNYSVASSDTTQTVNYVKVRHVDEPNAKPDEKPKSTHVEVSYHIVNILVPMGFARDGTPLTRKGMDIQRVEKEVPDK